MQFDYNLPSYMCQIINRFEEFDEENSISSLFKQVQFLKDNYYMIDIIIKAIKNQNTISFSYNGQKRVVEPHHLGVFGTNEQIHGYQVNSEFSRSGWKNFIVSSMQDISINSSIFTPQRDYNPSGSRYSSIYISVLDPIIKDPNGPNDGSNFQP